MARADNTFRQVSTLRNLELAETNRILRKLQEDVASLRGQLGKIELRDALSLLAPPRDPAVTPGDFTTLFHDINRSRLRGSEGGNGFIDAFNSMGVWKSEQSATVGNQLSWDSQLAGEDEVFGWDNAAVITLKQSGLYLIAFRVLGSPNAGSLRVNLTVGVESTRALYAGLGGNIAVINFLPYVKVDDGQFTEVTLDLTAGTSIGSTGLLASYLVALKVS